MPEHVRVHVLGQALQPRPAGDAPLHDARPEAARRSRRRTRPCSPTPASVGALREPALQRRDRLPADRHDARLAALAERRAPCGRAGRGRPGRARAVPPAAGPTNRSSSMIALSRTPRLSSARNSSRRAIVSASSVRGRRLRAFGACTSRGRVALQLALAQQVAEEAAHGRQPALDAARREAAPVARAPRSMRTCCGSSCVPVGDALRRRSSRAAPRGRGA